MNPDVFNRLEKDLDHMLDLCVTHPYFLKSVNLALRLNVYRKLFVKKSLQQIWKNLELPTQKDQLKTISMMQSLEQRLFEMEKKLSETQKENLKLKQTVFAASSNADVASVNPLSKNKSTKSKDNPISA